jgi:hypothetical protein
MIDKLKSRKKKCEGGVFILPSHFILFATEASPVGRAMAEGDFLVK